MNSYNDDNDDEIDISGSVHIKLDIEHDGKIVMSKPQRVEFKDISDYCRLNKYCHEVITGDIKPYYDVENYFDDEDEWEGKRNQIMVTAAREIQKAHPKSNVMSFDSSGWSLQKKQWKQSAHFIVNGAGYYSQGLDILPTAQSFRTPGFDLGVYKAAGKQQNIRIPYAVKLSDPTRKLRRAFIEGNQVTILSEMNCAHVLSEGMADWMITNVSKEKFTTPKVIVQPSRSKSDSNDEVERVVMGLSDKRAASYQGGSRDGQWLEVLIALKNIETYPDEHKDLAHRFSMKCPDKYCSHVVDAKYEQLTQGTLTIASLYSYLKIDNKKLFDIIQAENKIKRESFNQLTIKSLMSNQIEPTSRKWTAFDFKYFVEQMNDKNEIIFEELNEYLSTTMFYVFKGGNASWYTKNKCNNSYIYTEISVGSPFTGKRDIPVTFNVSGKKIETTIDAVLEQSKHIRAKSDFVFEPYFSQSDMHNPDQVNMFTGHQVALKVGPINTDKVKFLNDHVHILCGLEQHVTDYTTQWMAMVIQQPKKKMPFLVSISRQGAGKGTFFDEFFRQRILGIQYTKYITNPNLLVGDFNSDVKGSMFTIIAETKENGASISNNEIFKSLTSDVSVVINEKHQIPYPYKNYAKFIVLSNNANPVHIAADDRRTVVFRADTSHLENDTVKKAYFSKLHMLKDDPEAIQDYFTYLATLDLSNFDPDVIPDTKAKSGIKGRQMPSALEHIKYLCENAEPDLPLINGKGFFSITAMYKHYRSWCQLSGNKPSPDRYYKQEIQEVGLVSNERQATNNIRKRGMTFDIEELQSRFRKHLKEKDFTFDLFVPLDEE